MRLSLFLAAIAAVAVLQTTPAHAATFVLHCAIDSEEYEYDFLFDTRKAEVLHRRPGTTIILAKFQKMYISMKDVVWAKYALMGSGATKYRTGRSGGILWRAIRKRKKWSAWEQAGHCKKP